jgi:MFS family permease
VVGTVTGVAVVTAPLTGPLIDRFGVRATAAGGGVALAVGYAGLAFAHTPAAAFAAAAFAGAGNGALVPTQSTLLAALAPRDRRHRASAVSRVATNAGFGLGGALGGIVAANGLNGFVALFVANAVTYLVYVTVLVVVVKDHARPVPIAGGYEPSGAPRDYLTARYRVVLRDRAFLHLALVNVAMIGVGWGVLPWVIPPYAQSQLGVGDGRLGLLLLANAATVVVAQVPIARLAEGRRRVVLMALGACCFAAAFLLVLAGGTYSALVVAAIVIAVGECLHSSALMPLVADLAPAGLRGRYMAAIGLSWWIGLALAPTLGTQLLSASPPATLIAAATIALAAGASALTLERRLPEASRLTPRPA